MSAKVVPSCSDGVRMVKATGGVGIWKYETSKNYAFLSGDDWQQKVEARLGWFESVAAQSLGSWICNEDSTEQLHSHEVLIVSWWDSYTILYLIYLVM